MESILINYVDCCFIFLSKRSCRSSINELQREKTHLMTGVDSEDSNQIARMCRLI